MIRKIISIIISLLFILGLWFNEYLYSEYWFFSGFLLLIPIIGIILVIFLNIKRDKYAVYVALTSLLIGSVLLIVRQTELFKSPIVLKAVLVDDLSALELYLRDNNEFELIPMTYLGRTESFKGKYKIEGNKIIFFDRPYDNKFIRDTVFMINNKIILRFDSIGKPDTTFANYFRIDKFEKE